MKLVLHDYMVFLQIVGTNQADGLQTLLLGAVFSGELLLFSRDRLELKYLSLQSVHGRSLGGPKHEATPHELPLGIRVVG